MILTKSSSAEIGLGILLVLLVSSPVASSQQLDSNYLGTYSIIAHQAAANPLYGVLGLQLLSRGLSPEKALEAMLRSD